MGRRWTRHYILEGYFNFQGTPGQRQWWEGNCWEALVPLLCSPRWAPTTGAGSLLEQGLHSSALCSLAAWGKCLGNFSEHLSLGLQKGKEKKRGRREREEQSKCALPAWNSLPQVWNQFPTMVRIKKPQKPTCTFVLYEDCWYTAELSF